MSKWTLADIPSQAGKCAFITGANSGIGFHAARRLAGAGCAVILGCRDAKKGEAARQRIEQDYGPDGFMELKGKPVEVKAKPQALDQVSAARLWSVSENSTGVRYSALD